MGSISAHMHSCMHCGRAQSDTMVAAVHGCCSVPPWRRTLPSSRIRILVRVWTGMRPDALVLSILSPEWEDKPSRETKVLYWNAVATLFRPLAEACKDSSMTRTALGLEDSSRIPTVSVLQGSQVALSCQRPCGYGRDLNVYIHHQSLALAINLGRSRCSRRSAA
jgi:hypothetical protein